MNTEINLIWADYNFACYHISVAWAKNVVIYNVVMSEKWALWLLDIAKDLFTVLGNNLMVSCLSTLITGMWPCHSLRVHMTPPSRFNWSLPCASMAFCIHLNLGWCVVITSLSLASDWVLRLGSCLIHTHISIFSLYVSGIWQVLNTCI